MKRHLCVLALASVALTTAGCAAQSTVNGTVSPTSSAGSSAAAGSTSAPALSSSISMTSAAGVSSAPTTAVVVSSSYPAITAATTSPAVAELKSAQAKYVAIAKTVFPGAPTATVVNTAKTLCSALAGGSSLHDEVGQLAGQVQGQRTAEDLVRAAVGAYCPTVVLH